jgi:stage II sporulation protein AA (anti-sigma F factor antagonist)
MRYRHVEDHDIWQATRCEAEVLGTPHDARAASNGTCPISDEFGGALFIVAHEREGGVDVICGSGEIDISTVAALRDALREVVQHATGPVVVDLSQVSFMDSSGIHVLSATARQLTAQQRSLALACREGGAVHRVLSLVGPLGRLSVHPSRQNALTAAAPQARQTRAAPADGTRPLRLNRPYSARRPPWS